MKEDQKIVVEFVNLQTPYALSLTRLQSVGLHSGGDDVTVSGSHVANAISLYMRGRLSGLELEDWASNLEVREDVIFVSREVKDAVHEIGNPVLFGGSNNKRLTELLNIFEG